MTRTVPYEYTCEACGAVDEASNARGPRRTRCRACMFGKTGIFRARTTVAQNLQTMDKIYGRAPKPEIRRCGDCGASVPAEKRRGPPRRFCETCRPTKPQDHARAAVERRRQEREHWQDENPLSLKPHLLKPRGM